MASIKIELSPAEAVALALAGRGVLEGHGMEPDLLAAVRKLVRAGRDARLNDRAGDRGRAAFAPLAEPRPPRPPREVIHYGMGVTDCGRDGASLPPSHKWNMDRSSTTCGECIEARAHLDAKVRRPGVH